MFVLFSLLKTFLIKTFLLVPSNCVFSLRYHKDKFLKSSSPPSPIPAPITPPIGKPRYSLLPLASLYVSSVKFYSTSSDKLKNNYLTDNSFLYNILLNLQLLIDNNQNLSPFELQLKFEEIINSEYSEENKQFNLRTLLNKIPNQYNKEIVDYLFDNEGSIVSYLNKITLHEFKRKSIKNTYLKLVFTNVGLPYLKNIIFLVFLQILTYVNTSIEEKYLASSVLISTGKRIFYHFIIKEKDLLNSFSEEKLSFSEFYVVWLEENPEFYENFIKEDNLDVLFAELGGYLLKILLELEMIEEKYFKQIDLYGKVISHKYFMIKSKDFLHKSTNFNTGMPSKLPMVCPPKDYGFNSKGGYLLNDVKYHEPLIIKKSALATNSIIEPSNIIFNMVNSMGKTPFRINKTLLEFLKGIIGFEPINID